MDETAEYICPTCGEPIQIVVDPSAGAEQEYIEDCPVCCNPNRLRIHFDRNANADVEADAG